MSYCLYSSSAGVVGVIISVADKINGVGRRVVAAALVGRDGGGFSIPGIGYPIRCVTLDHCPLVHGVGAVRGRLGVAFLHDLGVTGPVSMVFSSQTSLLSSLQLTS